MGTMEWLWCLGVLHPMQFFHTLLPFRLLSGYLAHLTVISHSRMGWLASLMGETTSGIYASFVMADNNLILCHFRSFARPLGRAQAGGSEKYKRN